MEKKWIMLTELGVSIAHIFMTRFIGIAGITIRIIMEVILPGIRRVGLVHGTGDGVPVGILHITVMDGDIHLITAGAIPTMDTEAIMVDITEDMEVITVGTMPDTTMVTTAGFGIPTRITIVTENAAAPEQTFCGEQTVQEETQVL